MRIKRVLLGIGGVVLVLVATPIVAFAVTMAGDSPVKDGEALGSRAKQVKDGFVTVGMIDIGSGGVALVDCGNDKDAKAIFGELKKRHMDETAVKAIFLTHGHADHTMGCAKFQKADVYAMAVEKDLVEGKVGAKGPMPRFFGAKDVGARVTHTLQDGEVVKIGDVDVTAFATPGHTAGSATYFADGVLYFGDAASGSKEGKVTPPKYLFSDDQKQGIASLESLAKKLEPRASEVKTLEFAHTGTLSGFEPLRNFGH
jgi:glyoxylase-like metal-dependent hydrolase (beta-lactamase superfamily II)